MKQPTSKPARRHVRTGLPTPAGPPALEGLDDAALVAELVGGREEALGELYDRYADVVMAIGVRMLRDRREAEDLLHDVFVEAWRRAADFDSNRGSVRTWLLTRARSRALDRCKSPGRVRAVPLGTHAEDQRASEPPADRDGHDQLRKAVAALTADQRAVVECAYFDGLSSAEIGTRLGIPIGTVKSRMAAALTRLRAALIEP